MTTLTAEFTIRETTYYTGILVIDTGLWEQVMSHPFDAETVNVDDLRSYQDLSGTEVQERDGNVDGQEWTDVDFHTA